MILKSCCRRLLVVAVLAAANIASAESVAPLQDQQTIPAGQPDEILYIQEGTASWYGKDFHGKATSNGEEYDMHDKTCAHKTLPLNTYVRITNLKNGSSTLLRVNDRGPFVKDRIVDVSYAAARELDMVQMGTGRVRLEAMGVPQGEKWDIDTLAEAITHGNFTVQVGSFKDKDKAQQLVKKLAPEFEDTRMLTQNSNQGKFYRVRVGRYESLEEAEKACQVLGDKGYRHSFAMAE